MAYFKNVKGFTLVEIMIVVAIISLLVTIAIPNLMEARKSANATAAGANIRALGSAAELAWSSLGRYPQSRSEMQRFDASISTYCLDFPRNGSWPDTSATRGYIYSCYSDLYGYSFQASPTDPASGDTWYGMTSWGGLSSGPMKFSK